MPPLHAALAGPLPLQVHLSPSCGDSATDSELTLMPVLRQQHVALAIEAEHPLSSPAGASTVTCGRKIDHGVLAVGHGAGVPSSMCGARPWRPFRWSRTPYRSWDLDPWHVQSLVRCLFRLRSIRKLGWSGRRLQVHFRILCRCVVRQRIHGCVSLRSYGSDFTLFFYVKETLTVACESMLDHVVLASGHEVSSRM